MTAAVAFGVAAALADAGAPRWAVVLGFFAPIVVGLLVVVLGGKRLLNAVRQRLPSPERRALRQSAQTPAGTPAPVGGDWPTVPQAPHSVERATTLAVRLAPGPNPAACAAGCLVPLAMGWLIFLVPYVVKVIQGHVQGQPDWQRTFLLIPFILGGIALIGAAFFFAGQLIALLIAGPVVMEISANPLTAGGRYDLWIAQQGKVPVRQVHLRLICEESATYRQGTSTATSTRQVFTQDVLHPQTSSPDTSLVGGVRCPLEVPPDVMHSFAAANNKITWKLELRGRVGSLRLRLNFPVIVYPEVP
jgi:hypothetical protein